MHPQAGALGRRTLRTDSQYGSRDELPSEYGLAHLLEHSFFKGTTHRKSYHINCRLENLGGELNAYTTKEETVIHTTTLKSDAAKAVELIADIVFHSVFPQKEIDREKRLSSTRSTLQRHPLGTNLR